MKLSTLLCIGPFAAGAMFLAGCATGAPDHVHVADGFFEPEQMVAQLNEAQDQPTTQQPVIRLAAGDALGQAVFEYHRAYVLAHRGEDATEIYTRASE